VKRRQAKVMLAAFFFASSFWKIHAWKNKNGAATIWLQRRFNFSPPRHGTLNTPSTVGIRS
jgi:hypothetical protein